MALSPKIDQFLHNIGANLAAYCLWALLAVLWGAVTAFFSSITHGLSRWQQAGILAAVTFCFACLFVGIVLFRRAKNLQEREKHVSLAPVAAQPSSEIPVIRTEIIVDTAGTRAALDILKNMSRKLLQSYRELDMSIPDVAQRPLDHNSWPYLSEPNGWASHMLKLWRNSRNLCELIEHQDALWDFMGWPIDTMELGDFRSLAFPVPAVTMVELLARLEKFDTIIDGKIKEVQQAAPHISPQMEWESLYKELKEQQEKLENMEKTLSQDVFMAGIAPRIFGNPQYDQSAVLNKVARQKQLIQEISERMKHIKG